MLETSTTKIKKKTRGQPLTFDILLSIPIIHHVTSQGLFPVSLVDKYVRPIFVFSCGYDWVENYPV